MRWRWLLVVSLLLLASTATGRSALAGGYWRFYISVDGKPAFTGGMGVFGEFLPLEHLESSVQGGVQLGTDSYLDENTAGDVTLTGDVVFRDQQHPPLHMQRLRLVYARDESDRASGSTVAGGYYDWRLHPEDAAFIVAHYRKEAGLKTDEKSHEKSDGAAAGRRATTLGAIGIGTAIGAVLVVVWTRRRWRAARSGAVELTAG